MSGRPLPVPAAPSDDERVCPVCGPLDGKTVRLDEEFAPGIFAPPAHPNCRCTTLAPTELDEVEVRKYPGQPRDEKGRFAEGKQPKVPAEIHLAPGVYPVGNIDPAKFSAAAEADTDLVVLTPRQARHIMTDRPGVLERRGPELPAILSDPDAVGVLPAARRSEEPQWAHVFRRDPVPEGGGVELIVWLHTARDTPGHANLLVTMFEHSQGRLERRMKQLELVYVRPGT
ncbi:MAG: hypothetical protein K6U08_00740 [Firmicutes bacterium]|nr:hypothetical protein [Bacillota bacterium]